MSESAYMRQQMKQRIAISTGRMYCIIFMIRATSFNVGKPTLISFRMIISYQASGFVVTILSIAIVIGIIYIILFTGCFVDVVL